MDPSFLQCECGYFRSIIGLKRRGREIHREARVVKILHAVPIYKNRIYMYALVYCLKSILYKIALNVIKRFIDSSLINDPDRWVTIVYQQCMFISFEDYI